MTKVIAYTHIKGKVVNKREVISDEEALIRALDLMDFNAALASLNDELKEEIDHRWIVLNHSKK